MLTQHQTKISIPNIIEQYAEAGKISHLEEQIRKKIVERWDLQKNKNQKQLDFYLSDDC